MRHSAYAFALLILAACSNGPDNRSSAEPLTLENELGFRQLREEFHLAATIGDVNLMRSLWAADAVLTTADGSVYRGVDAIADLFRSDPQFGRLLVLTVESSWRVATFGDVADFGFETVSIDVGGGDPRGTTLSEKGVQNPSVEIVSHTHSTGLAARESAQRWVLQEVTVASGPLSLAGPVLAQENPLEPLPVEDELGFRRLREDFHLANLIGDAELMRTVWADDGVFVTGGGARFEGREVIVDFFASGAMFGRVLTLTPEASQRIVMRGDTLEYGFECISIAVGGNDPQSTDLCTPEGTQNPEVEIIQHTHSIGTAVRVGEARWAFREFNGGVGPLPPVETDE
jgi:hypothetical protein